MTQAEPMIKSFGIGSIECHRVLEISAYIGDTSAFHMVANTSASIGWLTFRGKAMASSTFSPLKKGYDPTHDLKCFIGSLHANLRDGNDSSTVNIWIAG